MAYIRALDRRRINGGLPNRTKKIPIVIIDVQNLMKNFYRLNWEKMLINLGKIR